MNQRFFFIGLAFLAVGLTDAQRTTTTTRSPYKVKDVKLDENYVNITMRISPPEGGRKSSMPSVKENITMEMMRRLNMTFRAYRLFQPGYTAFQYPKNTSGIRGLTVNKAYSVGFSLENPPRNATYVTTTTPAPENATTTEAPTTTTAMPNGAQQFPNSQRNMTDSMMMQGTEQQNMQGVNGPNDNTQNGRPRNGSQQGIREQSQINQRKQGNAQSSQQQFPQAQFNFQRSNTQNTQLSNGQVNRGQTQNQQQFAQRPVVNTQIGQKYPGQQNRQQNQKQFPQRLPTAGFQPIVNTQIGQKYPGQQNRQQNKQQFPQRLPTAGFQPVVNSQIGQKYPGQQNRQPNQQQFPQRPHIDRPQYSGQPQGKPNYLPPQSSHPGFPGQHYQRQNPQYQTPLNTYHHNHQGFTSKVPSQPALQRPLPKTTTPNPGMYRPIPQRKTLDINHFPRTTLPSTLGYHSTNYQIPATNIVSSTFPFGGRSFQVTTTRTPAALSYTAFSTNRRLQSISEANYKDVDGYHYSSGRGVSFEEGF
ncbi:hypothetical protein ACFFRR_000126 [Megaselia abdita]